MQIRWQDDAINDLIQVRRFIAMDNPSAATRVANRIRSAVPELAKQPWYGQTRTSTRNPRKSTGRCSLHHRLARGRKQCCNP